MKEVIMTICLLLCLSIIILVAAGNIKDSIVRKKMEKLRRNPEYQLARADWEKYDDQCSELKEDIKTLKHCRKIFEQNKKEHLLKATQELIDLTKSEFEKTKAIKQEYYQKLSDVQERIWKVI